MARFYGNIGFMNPVEGEGSVWSETYVWRPYYGELIRHSFRYNKTDKLNDDVALNNEISIFADDFAYSNYHLMRAVEIDGILWTIESVTVDRPRITLSVGGVYNVRDDD